ncbi:MAG: hypothetical protein V1909_05730, partial [Candidatus Micrarchaeota archaeon]
EKAFGERRADLLRVIPLSEFRKREIDPYPGMPVQLDNMTAMVKSVTSGRVMVDMNHPLAGHKVVYEVKLSEVVLGADKKAEALLDHFDLKGQASLKGEEVHVTFGPEVEKDSQYLVRKSALAEKVLSNIPEIKKIRFEEIYERKDEKKEEGKGDKKDEKNGEEK